LDFYLLRRPALELARLGHSRDDKSGKLQIVFGLLTNAEGCPVAVEVWEGNTADPKTIPDQVKKLHESFGLQRLVLVGDRGMITSARIREDFAEDSGISWITALRAASIPKLAADGALQLSLFDTFDLAEIAHPDYPGERLVVCFNPVLSEERGRHLPRPLRPAPHTGSTLLSSIGNRAAATGCCLTAAVA
jgi:hypothetical protein